jgi:hypothetical protein
MQSGCRDHGTKHGIEHFHSIVKPDIDDHPA